MGVRDVQHGQAGPDATLGARIERLEELARGLTKVQLTALAAAIRDAKARVSAWPADERFWFSGRGGAPLTSGEDRAIRQLWTRVQVGLTFAVTQVDIDPSTEVRPKQKRGRLARLLQSEEAALEGQAATLLERDSGGEIWLSVTGVWNAFCAALLAERLDPELRTALETPWRIAIGATPRENLAK